MYRDQRLLLCQISGNIFKSFLKQTVKPLRSIFHCSLIFGTHVSSSGLLIILPHHTNIMRDCVMQLLKGSKLKSSFGTQCQATWKRHDWCAQFALGLLHFPPELFPFMDHFQSSWLQQGKKMYAYNIIMAFS
uniref:Uncharacterized protein n=1 Tax=Sphaerodactylus townsendi TaxID=933632 RepID=A0ACB8EIA0_9SAUR